MRKEAGVSPWTLQTERSQLSKVFMVDLDYIQLPKRTTSTKGRSSDPHWNPANHPEQIRFYESIGARKNEYRFLKESEIQAIEKKLGKKLKRDVHGRVSNLQIHRNSNGKIESITVLKAKHGKTNHSVILPENQDFVTEQFESGNYENFYNPPDHCNVHACRREYAKKLYFRNRRDLSTLSENELYRCRGELLGCVYDKEALDIVSKSLGHGNGRYYDVVHRYLR